MYVLFAAPPFAVKEVKSRKARYATFRIKEDTDESGPCYKIVPDKVSARNATYKDFLKDLPDTQNRFTIYDYEFKTSDGRMSSTIYFIYWIAPNCNTNERILYSTAKNHFTLFLTGVKLVDSEDKEELEELLKAEQR